MAKFNVNQIINKATVIADRLAGVSSRQLKRQADTIYKAQNLGLHGIPKSTVSRANRMSKVESGRSFQTRAKALVGTGIVGTAGFLGLHKYHQHKDNKILQRIDSMYNIE